MWTPSKLPIVTTDPGPPASPAGNSWSSSIGSSAGQHLGRPEQAAVELSDTDQLAGGIVHPALSGHVRQDRSGQPHRLAAPDLEHLRRSQIDEGQMRDRDIGRQERQPRIVHDRELVERNRRSEPERAVARPGEPAEESAGAERLAEVGGEHAHVRALAADHHDLGLRTGTRPEVDQLGRVDGHASWLPDHLLTGSGELVEVPPLMPDCRMHRWNLLDLADEPRELGANLVGADRAGVGAGDDHALGVARVTALAETNHAVIGLGLGVEIVDESGAPADADREQAGRGGIERPRVADSSLAEDASNLADGVERCDPGGLVEGEHASSAGDRRPRAWARSGRSDAGHRAGSINRRATSSTLRSATGRGSRNSAPAARRWPPPPNGVQTSVASMGSRVRTLILLRSAEISLKRIAISMEAMLWSASTMPSESCRSAPACSSMGRVTSDQSSLPSI